MKRNSFIIYKDWRNTVSMLTDTELGQLFRAIMDYQCDGALSSGDEKALKDNRALAIVWGMVYSTFERDNVKYEDKCRTNRENGARGAQTRWLANATERYNSLPNATERDEPVAKIAYSDSEKESESDSEKESESDSEKESERDNEKESERDNESEKKVLREKQTLEAETAFADLTSASMPLQKVGHAESYAPLERKKRRKQDDLTPYKWTLKEIGEIVDASAVAVGCYISEAESKKLANDYLATLGENKVTRQKIKIHFYGIFATRKGGYEKRILH